MPIRIGYDRNISNRSFFALQIGQTSGGASRAARYPQTLHLHTGYGRFPGFCVIDASFVLRSVRDGLRSGMAGAPVPAAMISPVRYSPQ